MDKESLKTVIIVFLILLSAPTLLSYGQEAKERDLIYVGMPKGTNPYSSNHDFNHAMSYWVSNLLKDSNEKTDLQAAIKQIDIDLLSEQYIEESNLYFLHISSADYFRFRHNIRLTPYLATVKPEGIKYLIVTNNKINSIHELENTRPIFVSSLNFSLSQTWLEYILQSENISSKSILLSGTVHVDNEFEAINSLFFDKGDLCIITKEAYNTAVELNPQILRRTNVLVESEGFIPTLFCLTKKVDKKTKQILNNSVKNLTKSESGKQILKMFKIDRICFMNDIESTLKGTETLINNFNELHLRK